MLEASKQQAFRSLERRRCQMQTLRLNLLTPNVNYSGRTAQLTSKVAFYTFMQQIF